MKIGRKLMKHSYIIKPEQKFHKDFGFMGVTHALSVLAVSMMILAFAPSFATNVLNTDNAVIWALFVATAIGAGNLPDLDNTRSRAKSDLGPFGDVLSVVFRTSSSIIQTTVRTKRDDPSPNPHRGAWHTIPAALLLGFLVYMGTRIDGDLNLPIIGATTWGGVFALVISFVLIHLTLSTLAKKSMDKVKRSAFYGEIIAVLISFTITFVLMKFIPDGTDFWWLSVAVAFGMTIHILGDCFTTAGAPILFPLSGFIKGKFWWTTRFLPIKAGGPFENYVFVPTFIILSIIGTVKILIL